MVFGAQPAQVLVDLIGGNLAYGDLLLVLEPLFQDWLAIGGENGAESCDHPDLDESGDGWRNRQASSVLLAGISRLR